jgi:hypothetical protein
MGLEPFNGIIEREPVKMSDTVKYNLICNHVETGEGYGGVFWAEFCDQLDPEMVAVYAPLESPFDYKPGEEYEFEIPKRFLNEAVVQLADARTNDEYASLMSIYGIKDGIILRLVHEHAKRELKDKLKSKLEADGSQTPYYDIDELKKQYLGTTTA